MRLSRRLAWAILAVVATSYLSNAQTTATPDVILYHGAILTGEGLAEGKPKIVAAIAIANGTVVAAGPDGLQRWTVNGKSYPDTPVFKVKTGRRYRLDFVNSSSELHPLHLHRHSFEIASIAGRQCSGLIKDVVNIAPYSSMKVDFVADNPGKTLFHCHQQLHMDYGFMQLIDYA